MHLVFGSGCDDGVWDDNELTPQQLRSLRRQGARVVRVTDEDANREDQDAHRTPAGGSVGGDGEASSGPWPWPQNR